MGNMRSIKVSIIASENIEKFTICVTVDKKLFKYKTKEEIAEMIDREIGNAINIHLPLNNVKCRYYACDGQCFGQKNAPRCDCDGDARKCKILNANVKY